MSKAQENLKADIEKIDDDLVIEKIRIFILGILAQKGIEEHSSNEKKNLLIATRNSAKK